MHISKTTRFIGVFGTLLLVGAVSLSGAPGGPERAAGGPAGGTSFGQDLLKRLNSADPAEKLAAQKQLDSIAAMFQNPDILQQLADATTDADLKALFRQRLDQLKQKEEMDRASNLPGISLSVKNASLSQLVDALNESLHTSAKFQKPNGADAPAYTLDAKDKPFWDVYVELQKQQPTDISIVGTNMRLAKGRMNRQYAIGGPAIAWINAINYQRAWNFDSPDTGAGRATLSVSITMATDPRLHMAGYKMMAATSAVDDEGRKLQPNSPGGQGGIAPIRAATTPIANMQFSLEAPTRLGKSLSFGCESSLSVVTGETLTTVDDVQSGKTFTLGERMMRIATFDQTSPSLLRMQISSTVANPGGAAPAAETRSSVTLYDGSGASIWTGNYTGAGTMASTVTGTHGAGPFKLEFRSTTKTLDIPVHFEFKDIAIP